ncbi:hypothetical protein FIV34_11895 [Luteibacter pinisoli]|uniref:KAP NTPase domain-containing protein n=1 Tax=Luteibacter pinisoli TaxID=2589080 RepID=A0A4Y5Z3C3_9GAMM|nr:P-loop NTPase fold protein [Luteibacter pinisoli]QDE39862.1 hypothetical protein FIV34_11895 [Luteibacter pinisoli]
MSPKTPRRPFPKTLAFIQDAPAKKDSFGGAHRRIASLIAHNIVSNDTIKVVGLLGPWGSGKSTVVALLGRRLHRAKGRHHCEVFTFDAWMHQSDAPRRSFIETLVAFFAGLKDHAYATWRDDFDRIIGRSERTRTIEVRQIPKRFVPVVYGALGVPVGTLLLGRCDVLGRAWPSIGAGWIATVGTLCMFAPLAAALYVKWFSVAPDNEPGAARERLEHPKTDEEKAEDKQSPFLYALREEAKHTTRRIIKDPVPTTMEFQRLVRKIIHAGLTEVDAEEGQTGRLLVVIDNLDRLPDGDAIELLATMRSLFLGPDGQTRSDQLRGVTILVPLDDSALRRQHKEHGAVLTEAFIDKTFDLTVRLPRPLFTEWRSHFRSSIERMFGGWMDADTVSVLERLLDSELARNEHPVTPRRINAIVNRFGVLWLLWARHGAGCAAMLHYAISQAEIDADIWRMTEGQPLLTELEPDWAQQVCAMHFGVSPDTGVDVLIERALPKVIEKEDSKAFSGMAYKAGFPGTFYRFVAAFLQPTEARIILNSAALAATLADSLRDRLREAFDLLAQALARSIGDSDVINRTQVLADMILNTSLDARLLLVNLYLQRLGPGQRQAPGQTAFYGLLDLVRALETSLANDSVPSVGPHRPILIHGTAANLLNVLNALGADSPALPFLDTEGDIPGELLRYADSPEFETLFRSVLARRIEVQWGTEFVKELGRSMNGAGPIPSVSAVYILVRLCKLGDRDALKEASPAIAANGRCETLFTNAFERGKTRNFARVLVAFLVLNDGKFPTLPEPVNRWCDLLPELPEELADALDLMTDDGGASLATLDAMAAIDPRLAVRGNPEATEA